MDWIKEYGAIAALITAIIEGIGIYRLWRKMPREEQNLDADTVQKYINAADRAIELNEKLEKKVDELQIKANGMQSEIETLKKLIGEKDRVISEWAAGIDRLIHQICSLDAVPVWKPELLAAETANKSSRQGKAQPARRRKVKADSS
ncbi:MAG: hypothetical protein JW908_00505 [Anaerolineales bacterium]|nr:hypothetical protein [Anaerolineales bacterium]